MARQLFHITDWLPTILSLVDDPEVTRNDTVSPRDVDGTSVWNALKDDTTSPRRSVLHNIDDIYNIAGITIDNWKLIEGDASSAMVYKHRWMSRVEFDRRRTTNCALTNS